MKFQKGNKGGGRPPKPSLAQLAKTSSSNKVYSVVSSGDGAFGRDKGESGFPLKTPSVISYSTMKDMRVYPTIAIALSMVKLPLRGIKWRIKCDNAEITEKLDANLRPLWWDFIKDILMAYDYGWAGFEKVWTYDSDDGMFKYKKLLPLAPFNTKILTTEDGSFDGLKQTPFTMGGNETFIPAEKSFVFTYRKEYDNLYGKTRLESAWMPWHIIRYLVEFTMRYYEKYSDPPIMGEAPVGNTTISGKKYDNLDLMEQVLRRLQNSSVGVFPWTENKQWSASLLEAKRTGADNVGFLNYLRRDIMNGIMVPELTFEGGEKGSYNLFEGQADLFAQSIDGEFEDIKGHVDRYLIKPWVDYNYGPGYKAEMVFQKLSEKDKGLVRLAVQALIQNQKPEMILGWLSNQMGITDEVISRGKELASMMPDKPVVTEQPEAPVNAERFTFKKKRPLTIWEQQVDFSKINDRLNKMSKEMQTNLADIISQQKSNIQRKVSDIINRNKPSELALLEMPYANDYSESVRRTARGLFEQGKGDIESEMDLANIPIPADAYSWATAQARNVASKHLDDLRFLIVGSVLAGLSKDLSEKEVSYNVSQVIDEYVDEKLPISAGQMTHKFYEEGRDWAGEIAGFEYAQWSSVLDTVTCDFCDARDGMIIEVANPDFAKYTPGETHFFCRCIWVFIPKGENVTVNWRAVSQKDSARFYQ